MILLGRWGGKGLAPGEGAGRGGADALLDEGLDLRVEPVEGGLRIRRGRLTRGVALLYPIGSPPPKKKYWEKVLEIGCERWVGRRGR